MTEWRCPCGEFRAWRDERVDRTNSAEYERFTNNIREHQAVCRTTTVAEIRLEQGGDTTD
jgi:hypothetical protein